MNIKFKFNFKKIISDFHILWFVFFVCVMLMIIRTELLIGEFKLNLSPLKILYYLMNNIKAKHKLNQANYKLLGIISRLIIFGFDVASVCNVILLSTLIGITAIRSKQLFWIVEIFILPIYYVFCYTPQAYCIIFNVLLYYIH